MSHNTTNLGIPADTELLAFQPHLKLIQFKDISIKGYVMKSYVGLYARIEANRHQTDVAKKNRHTNAIKEVKRLCQIFGFSNFMLKGSFAEGDLA
jgi:hypothetical protein